MPARNRMARLGIIAALILTLSVCAVNSGAAAADQGPDQAMRAFIDAVVQRNPAGILASFSKASPWQYVGYEIGTGKIISKKMIPYAVMAKDFAGKQGWYRFFFDDPDGYTFRINFRAGEMWKKKGPATFVCPQSDSGNTYVTWRQEGGTWVIQRIAETGP
jgi:hypothetical protein